MSEQTIAEFRKRLAAYQKRRARRFALTGLGARDGRIPVLSVPWRALLQVLSLALLLKAALMLQTGEARYLARLDAYVDPSPGERIALALMRPDPISRRLHDRLREMRPQLARARGFGPGNRAAPRRDGAARQRVWSLWPTKKRAAPETGRDPA